jgi:hypothetical protein
MDIEIEGEGELVMRFIDKAGRTLMEERLTVSGAPKMTAIRVIDLSLRTPDGDAAVAPVLVSQSNAAQRIQFDGEAPAKFVRRRCKEIGCEAQVATDAARGVAPPPLVTDRPRLTSDEAVMERIIGSARR